MRATITPDTKVTVSFVALVFGAVYWLIMLGARVEAQERRQTESSAEILRRLDEHSDSLKAILNEQSDSSQAIAAIDARVALLVKWSEFKQDKSNR